MPEFEIETASEEREVGENSEQSIYDRLISELQMEKKRISDRFDWDQEVDIDLHGEDSGLLHIKQHGIEMLDKMIQALDDDCERQTIIEWLERKIENAKAQGKDTQVDERDLKYLKTLENGRDQRIAA